MKKQDDAVFGKSRQMFSCFCGKYFSSGSPNRYKHIICDECGVEVQSLYQMVRSIVEADRLREQNRSGEKSE